MTYGYPFVFICWWLLLLAGHCLVNCESFVPLNNVPRPHAETTTPVLRLTDSNTDSINRGGLVQVESSIDLPGVPAWFAYNAFAHLPNQPQWSPWLESVEVLEQTQQHRNDDKHHAYDASNIVISKWNMRYLGVRVSWTSQTTILDPPKLMAWESTHGLRNYGRVQFCAKAAMLRQNDVQSTIEAMSDNDEATVLPTDDALPTPPIQRPPQPRTTRMTLTLALEAPRFLRPLMRGSNSRFQRLVSAQMVHPTLVNFRAIVTEQWQKQRLPQHDAIDDATITMRSGDEPDLFESLVSISQ